MRKGRVLVWDILFGNAVSVAGFEGGNVLGHDFLSLAGEDLGDSIADCLETESEHRDSSSEQYYIGCLGRRSGFFGQFLHV